MNEAIVHRGPDHGAVEAHGRCVLGYRRLSIIDLATGDQPVANERGDVVAVFNGEIYNFRELRRELEAAGHEIRGTGDSPLIPHAYEEWGLGFAERLEGMFAIALWDRDARAPRARCATGSGKKPLVYTRLAGRLGRVRVGDEGAAAAARASRASSTSPSSTRSSRSSTSRARGCAAVEKVPPGSLRGRRGRLGAGRALLVAATRTWRAVTRRLGRARARGGDARRCGGGSSPTCRSARSSPAGSTRRSSSPRWRRRPPSRCARSPSASRTRATTSGRYARAVAERYGTRHEELEIDPRPGAPRAARAASSTSRSATRRRCRRCSSARRRGST